LAQVVAEELGLEPRDITMKIGDTSFPQGPSSGGSQTTNSITPAARNAAYRARQLFLEDIAPALQVSAKDLDMRDGKVVAKSDPSKLLTFKQAAGRMKTEEISARAQRPDDYKEAGGHERFITYGGVQFAQVAVDTETGAIKVEKVWAIHDCGRPMNPLLLENQINGGVLQGVSYALYEDRIIDRNYGYVLNPNLEQYKILGSRETPEIQVHVIENILGLSSTDAGGIGEPSKIPTAAAVANAVYNATGVRVRQLPMRPGTMLAALGKVKGMTA
jgi:xanthine dehydrogenase YagR molybdenum-binding subunit